MARLVIVSNRVTLPGEQAARAGGLAVAIREALRRYGGLWFGWSGDIVDTPADQAKIHTRGRTSVATIDLSPEEHAQYYAGYANSVLWPLFHYRIGLVEFRREHLAGYNAVNKRMAEALRPLLQPDDIIWVHDYHLIPLAHFLRAAGVRNRIGFFLHIPFPVMEVLGVLPQYEALLEHLCQYDLVGFQTQAHARAFRDCIVHDAHGRLENDTRALAFNREVRIDVFPVGIETERYAAIAQASVGQPESLRLLESLGHRRLLIGVDRLDYSKGLPLRFEAYTRLLEEYPEHRGKVVLMQVAPPSRREVKEYRTLRRELDGLAGRINGRFAEFDWVPVRYLNRSFTRNSLAGFYRIAPVGVVTPLRDGMNLVAKEYVAAQDPENPGVLVLSRFAGATHELHGALRVNPHDIDGVAKAMHQALGMPLEERKLRWQEMMDVLKRNTITHWFESFVDALQRTKPEEAPAVPLKAVRS